MAKFRGREDIAWRLGDLLAEQSVARAALRNVDCLVPVPLGARRRRQRGYNQSAILTRQLGKAVGLPVCHALVRCRNTRPQSDLSLALRGANVRDAFAATRRLPGRVALVDDVVTSGETVRQAAWALLRGRAQEVTVVALARTL